MEIKPAANTNLQNKTSQTPLFNSFRFSYVCAVHKIKRVRIKLYKN